MEVILMTEFSEHFAFLVDERMQPGAPITLPRPTEATGRRYGGQEGRPRDANFRFPVRVRLDMVRQDNTNLDTRHLSCNSHPLGRRTSVSETKGY